MKILFTYLTAFSRFGGIEKFNKAFIKVLAELSAGEVRVFSLHDGEPDAAYVSPNVFKGFSGGKITFLIEAIKAIREQDVVILGHINLAVLIVAKLLNPSLKIILITHGIEVWQGNMRFFQKMVLVKADLILAVSSFTKNELIRLHQVPGEKIKVFHNTIDPFFEIKNSFNKPAYLLERYQLKEGNPVLLSICRLSAEEGYKGYDTVLRTLPAVKEKYSGIKYLVVGKYDASEKERLEQLAVEMGVADSLFLTGFVPEEELVDHFLLGDVFVMPSTNEGFGIVFIEAMVCGLPVVAGNKDGSVDALANGALGQLVDPHSMEAITQAIINGLSGNILEVQKKEMQKKVVDRFGFANFRDRLHSILQNL